MGVRAGVTALALALALALGAPPADAVVGAEASKAKRCKVVKKKSKKACKKKRSGAKAKPRSVRPGPRVTDYPAHAYGYNGPPQDPPRNEPPPRNDPPPRNEEPPRQEEPGPPPKQEPQPEPQPGPKSGSPHAACDDFDPAVCLLPWPNDRFTVAADTRTGRRLALALTSMPRNVAGKPIDPIEFNRYDGFSPGTPIVTKIPGLDNDRAFEQTGLVPETDMARAFDADQPVVVLDADTGERHLVWAELDHHAETTSDADRVLIIRPGENFTEGHRYIVALRNLKRADGTPIEAQSAFKAYRDGSATGERKAHMEWIFRTLGAAGIQRGSLYLAWDFTVASEKDRAQRMLRMRDEAFAALGDTNLADLQVQGDSPEFSVTSAEDSTDGRVARVVKGTFTLPCYLDRPKCPQGSRFLFAGPDATDYTPIPGNTMDAEFTCIVPRKAIETGELARPSLYGHGLLGDLGEVEAGNVKEMAGEHNMMFCATDWYGMALEDLPTVATILADVSNFPALPDRVQQGILAQLFLARLMIHPEGFPSDPGFQAGGKSVIDTERAFYDGNSQGGIIGGALMAVSPDIERGVLGVPGMNYSTLLNRSVDFETDPAHPCPTPAQEAIDDVLGGVQDGVEDQEPPDEDFFLEALNVSYACPLYIAYPKIIERQLIFSLMQQHWDRGEANGYAHHMTSDPYPNTPPHEVLLHVALGDHQVAQVAAEVEARTIGAYVRPVAVDPFRSRDVEPQYGIPKISAWPFAGSVYELWDTGPTVGDRGTDVAPVGNVPPRKGNDPHSRPRATKAARQQKSDFLRIGGRATDQCGGGPCHSVDWTGFATSL